MQNATTADNSQRPPPRRGLGNSVLQFPVDAGVRSDPNAPTDPQERIAECRSHRKYLNRARDASSSSIAIRDVGDVRQAHNLA